MFWGSYFFDTERNDEEIYQEKHHLKWPENFLSSSYLSHNQT